jgi:2Fe-2S ferredoxin
MGLSQRTQTLSMTTLNVTDRDGAAHQLQAASGGTLMEVLRDADMGIAALCGGMCSCATCHVYIDSAWLPKLPAIQSDEQDVLNDLAERTPNSRLSCQIALSAEYNGLAITVAPEE